ncbi:MAG: sulfatase-like hydrolase/transferase [Armatimonadota bacterium]|nr:sulfatase-like hydrolase/transferase [Armatimonadota bacterium]MDR7453914.1 sulfatase-like hydrolase/transferase [Armatimonadota bacterium]MDR7497986.1 sulfatase-like hydrolase/transferase [Armatimonadota bacterium]MDR7511021.1 sulfatase-like hydrolase/transferase [Armatimonadota bacterium]
MSNGRYTDEWRQRVAQFLANTDDFASEDDWFAPQVVREAVGWLRKNRVHERVFLWVDCFDPHERWDPPARFDTYGDPSYRGPRLILPMGGPADAWASEAETRAIQALYAGEVTFVDACLAPFFAALGELGYLDDSIVVVLSDHGHPLGDHGKFLKDADRLYGELLRAPFVVRLPRGAHGGRRTDALVQFQDVLPTLLDLLGLEGDLDAMHGRSFRRVLEGERDEHRSVIITGYFEGLDRCVRTAEWSYIERPAGEPEELYHLTDDPGERGNVVDRHPDVASGLSRAFGRYYRPRRRPRREIQGKYELAASGLEEPILGS